MKNTRYFTKRQYNYLTEIKKDANFYIALLGEFEKHVNKIIKGEEDYVVDFIYNGLSLDEMLKKLNIKVKNKK